MFYTSPLTAYAAKHAFSVALAVFIAVVLNHYYSFSNQCWMALTAFLVSQTTRGTPFQQSLNFFLAILIALFFSSFLLMHGAETMASYLIAVTFILVSFILFVNRPLEAQRAYLLLCFLLVLLFSAFEPVTTSNFMHDRILDAAIGAAIGIFCGKIVIFTRLDKEFRQGLVPLLNALIPYSQAITHCFIHHEANAHVLLEKKLQVEQSLQTKQGLYPEWVYEVGFNPGLRSGFRFFLITLERIVELFFSMNFLVSRNTEIFSRPDQNIKTLTHAITHAMKKNQELLAILAKYLVNNEIKKTASDFTSDITELENALRRIIPSNLELLDISQDYITLTAFVRDIKDMRSLLLQLVMALPATDSETKLK